MVQDLLKKELALEILVLALTLFSDLIKTWEKKLFCDLISQHIEVQWGKLQGIDRLSGRHKYRWCYLGSASLTSKFLWFLKHRNLGQNQASLWLLWASCNTGTTFFCIKSYIKILVYFLISTLAMEFLTPYSFMLSLQKDTKSAKVGKLFARAYLILLPTKHPASDGRTGRHCN